MPSLERRVAELEKAGSTQEGPTTIVIRGIACGNLEEEIYKLNDAKSSQQWERLPEEAEQAFIDRASREVKRDGPGCALLISSD